MKRITSCAFDCPKIGVESYRSYLQSDYPIPAVSRYECFVDNKRIKANVFTICALLLSVNRKSRTPVSVRIHRPLIGSLLSSHPKMVQIIARCHRFQCIPERVIHGVPAFFHIHTKVQTL